MATKFAALNSHPRFSTPPRLCGLPAFPVAPRQNRHFSLPRIEVLVEPSDDSDDEGTLLSYHTMRLKRGRAPSPEVVDDLEKRKLVSYEATVAKKKSTDTDTANKWDYYVAPLSPLSDLSESDTSDSDYDVQSKPTKSLVDRDEAATSSRPKQLEVGLVTPWITDGEPSPSSSSSGLKRKRSCDSEIPSTSDTASAIEGTECPSKRRRCTSGTLEETFKAQKAVSSTTARPVLAMGPEEIKKSIRRYGKSFGTVRKPRVIRGASLRQREMARS